MLQHTLFALALVWLAGAAVTLVVAHYFTQEAFDRALLDDAYLLASNVHVSQGRATLDLTPGEVKAVLYDQQERVLFSVYRTDGTMISGDPQLRIPPDQAADVLGFHSITLAGRDYRAVALRRGAPVPFVVNVAQTTTAREGLLKRLILFSLAPQLLLLVALALWVRRSTDRDLQPLAELGRLVQQRGATDLKPLAIVGGTRDVEQLTDAVNSLLLRLERAVRDQREFTGNVAHELRTPLAGIRAMAEYGLKQSDPSGWYEQLRGIAANEARAARLLDKLLDIALASEAEMSLTPTAVPLDQIVRETVLRYLPRADKAGVDLGAHGIDSPVMVTGDVTLIEAILNNLIDNALRYGRPLSGEVPSITVAVERRGEEVVLCVLDNGPGLPHEQQAGLVDRRAQGEPGRLLGEGAGLGLALVAEYSRLLGARMALGSGPQERGWLCEIAFRPA
jgi:two-component system sensor histidine kinase TctE